MVAPKKTRRDEPRFLTSVTRPVQLRKLKIPRKFVKDHSDKLSNFARLRVPNGPNWVVAMNKSNGKVWLEKGWKEFSQNYSITCGFSVVFRCYGFSRNGNSRFQVSIFKPNGSEMEYVDTLPDRTSTEKRDQQRPGKNDTCNKMLQGSQKQSAKKPDVTSRINRAKKEEDQRNSPLERAKAFRSSNPKFTVNISKRNLSYNSGPVLPRNHCRDFFKRNDGNKKVILRVKEKSWNVEYRVQKNNKLFISLNFGWQKFALNNEIQEGDVCVFEMIRRHPKTYDVHLFRVSGKKMAKPTLNDEEIGILGIRGVSRDVMEKVNIFLGTRHGFAIRMRKSYISYQRPVHVPVSHSKEHLKDEGDDLNAIIINGKYGKTWKVKYRFEESCPRLGLGWTKVRSENCLKMGDVCAFKLIDKARKTYKLAIFRGNDEDEEV